MTLDSLAIFARRRLTEFFERYENSDSVVLVAADSYLDAQVFCSVAQTMFTGRPIFAVQPVQHETQIELTGVPPGQRGPMALVIDRRAHQSVKADPLWGPRIVGVLDPSDPLSHIAYDLGAPHPHVSPIKNWKQLVVVVVAAFILPIAVIVLLAQYVTDSPEEAKKDPSAVQSRIKPVGEFILASAMPPPPVAPAPAVAAASTAAAGGKPDGKKVYDTTCTACHSSGVAGAPKFGDKAAWAPHLAHGVEGLYEIALKGKGAMPPRGGNASLSDAEVKAGVDYMVAAAKK